MGVEKNNPISLTNSQIPRPSIIMRPISFAPSFQIPLLKERHAIDSNPKFSYID
jgi:hypothetical protein